MSKYLISTVETYRVDTEPEVEVFLAQAKEDSRYILSKYTSEQKEVKSKGEVIDEYFKVTLTKSFTDIKEPCSQVTINYEVD